MSKSERVIQKFRNKLFSLFNEPITYDREVFLNPSNCVRTTIFFLASDFVNVNFSSEFLNFGTRILRIDEIVVNSRLVKKKASPSIFLLISCTSLQLQH